MSWGTENAYKNAGKPYEPLKEEARTEMIPDRPFVVMVMITGSRHTESVQLWCPLIPADRRTRVLRISYVSRLDFCLKPVDNLFRPSFKHPTDGPSRFLYAVTANHQHTSYSAHRFTELLL